MKDECRDDKLRDGNAGTAVSQSSDAVSESSAQADGAGDTVAPGPGVFTYNRTTDSIAWSSDAYSVLGFDENEVEASLDVFLTAVHPEDRHRAENLVEDGMLRAPANARFRIVRAKDPTFIPTDLDSYTTMESWEGRVPATAIRWIDATALEVAHDDDTSSITLILRDTTTFSDIVEPGDVSNSEHDGLFHTVTDAKEDTQARLIHNVVSELPIGFFRLNAETSKLVAVDESMGNIFDTNASNLLGRYIGEFAVDDIAGTVHAESFYDAGPSMHELDIKTAGGNVQRVFISSTCTIEKGTRYIDGIVICPAMVDTLGLSVSDETTDSLIQRTIQSLTERHDQESAELDADDAVDINTKLDVAANDSQGHTKTAQYLSNWIVDTRDEVGVHDVWLGIDSGYEVLVEVEGDVLPTRQINQLTNFAPYPNQRVATWETNGVIRETIALSRDFLAPEDLDT